MSEHWENFEFNPNDLDSVNDACTHLSTHPAYLDANHPNHKMIVKTAGSWFQRKAELQEMKELEDAQTQQEFAEDDSDEFGDFDGAA